jgi:hypothetical protein
MNPEERRLLERTLKLSEENNEILKKMRAQARRQTIYGFIRLAIIILPFVIGYIFLEPYFDEARTNYSGAMELFNSLR